MVYQNKFVGAIKVDGKVLREDKGTVTIPFGSEYSVYLKNLNSVRAMVKVSVDGQDATEGTWLVVSPNSNIELERFIRNGNLQAGNRFKFIERTKEIEDHRGVQSDDGLIRIEYKFERRVEEVPVKRYKYYNEFIPKWVPPYRPYYNDWQYTDGSNCFTNTIGSFQGGQNVNSLSNCTLTRCSAESERSTPTMDAAFNDDGITVPGSESRQKFTATSWFDTETSDVLIIKLKGSKSGSELVTVQHKPKCMTCGKYNKATSKFCSQCGAALILV